MIIYKIQNKINGKIYIGQTRNLLDNCMKDHVRKNKYGIDIALNKYGIQSFDISVKEFYETPSKY